MSLLVLERTQELKNVDLSLVDFNELIRAGQPIILKGAFKEQALVLAGQNSAESAIECLQSYYSGLPLVTFIAPAEHKGRFFYNAEMTGMNFEAKKLSFAEFTQKTLADAPPDKIEACYAGSTDLPTYFPNLIEEMGLELPGEVFQIHKPLTSIWMGNRTTAALHYDMSNNVAACMVGRRRFTLFPPDQINNLYPGPISPTPAGQVVSMVDLNAPDFDRYPNFKEALKSAQIAELEPGDLLVYPAMWWHQVEALADFNILINYWWNEALPHMDTPMNMILYGMLALRDRPDDEKAAWKNLFDYYIFGPCEQARFHLPEHVHGPLSELDSQKARRLRQYLIGKLNR